MLKFQNSTGRTFFAAVVIAFALHLHSNPSCSAAELSCGPLTLSIASNEPIRIIKAAETLAVVKAPIAMAVLDANGSIHQVAGRYSAATTEGNQLHGSGDVTLPGGSLIRFSDIYTAGQADGSIRLARRAAVITAKADDKGFRTEFAVEAGRAKELSEIEPFVPGIWYYDNSHVPRSGLLSDPRQHDYLFREDRLPLPLAAFRERSSGLSVTLVHLEPDGATFPEEFTPDSVTDGRMQFGSLGLRRDSGLAVVFAFPGAEGDQTRVVQNRRFRRRSERFHPVARNFSQSYKLLIRVCSRTDFDALMRDSWRTAFEAMPPPIVPVSADRVYANSIDLLNHFAADYKGIPGLPFAVSIPDGKIRDVSMQMGFVGEQIPCAYHLITAGFARNDASLVGKGERIVDFWAGHAMTPEGLPRTWYDTKPNPHWRDYKTFTRIATDGMEGMLQAWRRMKLNRRDKPEWLSACRAYGNWLLAHQNSDGSFCRQYDFDGKTLDPSKSAATHPIRFLIDLFNATGDDRYLAASRTAGTFAVQDIGDRANYFGGTADNADVKDKEAGWIALDAFLSLYEATGDKAWLAAATKAGTFTETWNYCWNVPIPAGDPKVSLPAMKTTAGFSLIATGHSGADVFLAFAPFAYYRLGLYTHDPHATAMARVLYYDARQVVDVDGSHGYAIPGLLTEATNLAAPRGWGVGVWLPWCTAAVLDPMVQFQDAFGVMDLDAVEKLPQERRLNLLKTYADRHAFPPETGR